MILKIAQASHLADFPQHLMIVFFSQKMAVLIGNKGH
jgi:hypothetical protein